MMSFFSMPVAHLDDYIQLVQELIAATDESDPDFRNLKEVEKMLKETDQKCIMVDKSLNRLDKLRNLQSKFEKKQYGGGIVNFIDEGRVLVHEGMLRKQSKRKKMHHYHFHLFNDLLLYSEVNASGKFVLHRSMPLVTCRVDALETDVESIRLHKFKVSSAEKSFQVLASNAHERQTWLAKIQDAINECASKETTLDRTVAAEWETDSNCTTCPICEKTKFNMIERRHHCRKCGRVVCNSCSQHRVILTNIHATRKSRICDKCYTEIDSDSVNSFKLNLVVQKATFLAPRSPGGMDDRNPYCVASLRQIHFAKSKLPVLKGTNNPVWGTKGSVTFFVDNVSAAVLHLELWDHRALRAPVFLGQCETSLTDIPVDIHKVGANTQLSHIFKMELKPRNAKDKFCTGHLFFSVELQIPVAMLDKHTKYFSLLRRHMKELAKLPTPIALASVTVLHHEAKRRLEGESAKVEEHAGTPLIVVKDYKPASDGGLRLHEGEILYGVNQPSDDTWLGEDMDGEKGTFPSACVAVTEEGLTMESKMHNNFLQLEGLKQDILDDARASVKELPYEAIVNKVLGSCNFSALSERKKVIHEMLKSERVYVERLERFSRLYAKPLKEAANRGILKVCSWTKIFCWHFMVLSRSNTGERDCFL